MRIRLYILTGLILPLAVAPATAGGGISGHGWLTVRPLSVATEGFPVKEACARKYAAVRVNDAGTLAVNVTRCRVRFYGAGVATTVRARDDRLVVTAANTERRTKKVRVSWSR